MIHLIIFDLDGTLADTRTDIAYAVNLTRNHFGLAPLSLKEIISYVGNGSEKLIQRSFHDQPNADIKAVVCEFSRYYQQYLVRETRLYPGVTQGLEEFYNRGYPMAILSNKPGDLCRQFVAHFKLDKYFIKVLGGGDLPELKPHPMGIFEILKHAQSQRKAIAREMVWMVGDNSTDLKAGAGAGVKRVFCGFGFGDKAGLECDYEIFNFSELVSIIG